MAEVLTVTRYAPDAQARRAELFLADDGTAWVRLVFRLQRSDGTIEEVGISKSIASMVADGAITAAQRTNWIAAAQAAASFYRTQKGWNTP